jgi:hypothetical protein
MIEQDIAALIARDRADLNGLEANVWQRENQLLAFQQAGRTLISAQAAIVALSIIMSASAGVAMAAEQARAKPVLLFNSGVDLAPSSLLFGGRS